ncbi:MAG: PQQ-dependent sugar dehydrogenase [Acidimicrobiia bacterium]|nr:PQQ-dependent sugar dehydrogenase [Acidimicrobiia bacterium]
MRRWWSWRLPALVAAVAVTAASCTGGDGIEAEEPAASSTSRATSTTNPATTAAATSTTAVPPSTSTSTTAAPPTTTAPPAPLQGLSLETVATGLHQPTAMASAPNDPRLFVTERTGMIRVIDQANGLRPEPFLDLTDRVGSSGIEQGLLGLAFHPDFAVNGRLFAYYVTTEMHRRLSEFTVGSDGEAADPASERVLFDHAQPPGSVDIRHYGGMVLFGPEGLLYVSLGDGADASGQGQNTDTPFAAVLRIDVDSGDPYAIPPGNPFAGGGAPELWAYGLRNPWRFAIDPVEQLMYVADVGQDAWEEVNVVPLDGGGANFGWPDTEGSACFLKSDCDLDDYTLPVLEYDHSQGCSITGGVVYRGAAIPELQGQYFYADWCGMWVRSFRYTAEGATDEMDWSEDLPESGQVNAFGTDASGEMYLANFDGVVAKIVPVR